MTLNIQLEKQYQLQFRENSSDLLALPAIELHPTDPHNRPHIAQINIDVTGQPEDLVKALKKSYRGVDFRNSKLLKLATTQLLKQADCHWDGPLPTGVECVLTVTIDYFDSDEEGKPNLASPQTMRAECQLETLPETDRSIEMAVNKKDSEADYPGWFAIDFGTSNSTITLYDPQLVVNPFLLPSEQEQYLRHGLANWLNEKPRDQLPGVSAVAWKNEWKKLFDEISQEFEDFNLADHATPGDKVFKDSDPDLFLTAIRKVEIGLMRRLGWFKRSVSQQLNQIYAQTFRVPALEWQSLIPVELDSDRRLSEIPSELEVVDLEISPVSNQVVKVDVVLGEEVKLNRRRAINSGEEIEGRFLHSPKRYIGKDRSFKVTDGEKSVESLSVNTLLQAAYAHLIDLTEDYRSRYPDKCSEGDFYRAVMTYPTVATPLMRREIEDLVKHLGLKDVRMSYDEAVSVAIFFLWKEFGGDLNVGIEALKARCHYHKQSQSWWQNVLVLDIGGGTTDLALIRFTLEEINAFGLNEDRGDGGRYYKLTPKLLRSSGHLQLGGELITLRLFRLLKAAIADKLLSAVSEGQLSPDVLKVDLNELNPQFLDNNGKFKKDRLLACIDTKIHAGDDYQDALKDAEKVIPTQWKYASAREKTFYMLWGYAESAKLQLSQMINRKTQGDEIDPIFTLDGQVIADLLQYNQVTLPGDFVNSLSVSITGEQFKTMASHVIQEAVGIARGLIESTLGDDQNSTSPVSSEAETDNSDTNIEPEQLDWLILTGKTCGLGLVKDELYHQLGQSKHFLWNDERVTFEPEYAKLATSAGACLAEKFRQLSFAPEESIDLLQRGANQLYIDVKNLFYFLPCSFVRDVIGDAEKPIFFAGQELQLLDDTSPREAKCRSDWQGMQLTNNIQRKDFEKINPQRWGYFNGDKLMKALNIDNEYEFRKVIKVQFEINQKLDIDLLICRGKPHYLMDEDAHSLNAADKIGRGYFCRN